MARDGRGEVSAEKTLGLATDELGIPFDAGFRVGLGGFFRDLHFVGEVHENELGAMRIEGGRQAIDASGGLCDDHASSLYSYSRVDLWVYAR